MPSGFGGHRLNELECKDDIEDAVDLVKTEDTKIRYRRSNVLPTQEETQNLPYHPSATMPSKGATKIVTPMASSQAGRRASVAGWPINTLHDNPKSIVSRKRPNPKPPAEPPNDQYRPRKQQKVKSAVDKPSVDTDDEIMEVPPPKYEKKKGIQQQELQSFPRSKYFTDDYDLEDKMELDSKKQESSNKGLVEPARLPSKQELKGEEGLIASIHEILKRVPTSSSRGRWSSQGGESSQGGDYGRWSAPTPKRAVKPPREQYAKQCKVFRLLCLQTGLESFSEEDSPDLSIQIRIAPHPEIECLQGKSKVRTIDLTARNVIKKLHVNTPIRKFAIQIAPRITTEADRMVIFVLKNNGDIEDCKSAFKNVGVTAVEAEEKIFDNMSNKLKYWADRSQVIASEPQDTEATRRHRALETKRLSGSFRVEIPVQRRSARTCRVQNESPKRPKAPPTDDFEYSSPIETQSPKPKLELPKPPWETPLVYPPTGPRKEIIDYDDLKRLNSNSYLNDNIINFYLKYIEVQLSCKNPEVAKETYFLNTFFYERLTKRDDKRKRDIDSVLKWTAKVDIFKTSYIIIPINESTHWYLAIICNLCNIGRKINDKTLESPGGGDLIDLGPSEKLIEPKSDEPDVFATNTLDPHVAEPFVLVASEEVEDLEVVETPDNLEHMAIDGESSVEYEGKADTHDTEIIDVDSPIQKPKPKNRSKLRAKNKSPLKKIKNAMPPDTPSIIILDSMGFGPRAHNGTIKNLREWLVAEAQKKRNLKIDTGDIHAAFGKVPNQTNWYDCGLFLLHYVELFFEQPIEFTTLFLAKADRVSDTAFWRKEEIKGMREKLFHLFVQLHNEQVAGLSEQNRNENGGSKQKVEEGSKTFPDVMRDVGGPVQDKGMQDTEIAPKPIPTNPELGFEKFQGELGEFLASDKGVGKGNMEELVADGASQPTNLEETPNNSPQANRRIILPFRDSHDGEGVAT